MLNKTNNKKKTNNKFNRSKSTRLPTTRADCLYTRHCVESKMKKDSSYMLVNGRGLSVKYSNAFSFARSFQIFILNKFFC